MKNTLICTVGTSLLGNLKQTENPNLFSHLERRNPKDLSLCLLNLDSEDRICGAEINSNTSILKKGLISERLFLYFLISETEDGQFLGGALTKYYLSNDNPWRFEHVECRILEGLTDASPERFRTEGLRNLVRAIANIVQHHSSEYILINSTGGYKAQISFAGMIGQALEIPVCYLFERFSEVIILPPQPISLDLNFWLEHVNTFFALEAKGIEFDPCETDQRFASLVDVIEVNGRKLAMLSAVGQLFHETFRYRFQQQRGRLLPTDSGLEPALKTIRYEDSNKGKHRGLVTCLERLRDVPYVIRIYTHYFNPDLSIQNYFRPSAKGGAFQIEGGYSDGKATTKFDIVTTSKTNSQRDAVLAVLNERCH